MAFWKIQIEKLLTVQQSVQQSNIKRGKLRQLQLQILKEQPSIWQILRGVQGTLLGSPVDNPPSTRLFYSL